MIEKKRNKTLIIVFLLTCCSGFAHAQSLNESFATKSDTILDYIVTIDLPSGYKQKTTVYDEGKFVDFYYPDGSILTLFRGGVHKIPLFSLSSKHHVISVDTIGNRISYKGYIENKRWREDKIRNLHVYYNNVSIEKERMFDQALESIVIKKM